MPVRYSTTLVMDPLLLFEQGHTYPSTFEATQLVRQALRAEAQQMQKIAVLRKASTEEQKKYIRKDYSPLSPQKNTPQGGNMKKPTRPFGERTINVYVPDANEDDEALAVIPISSIVQPQHKARDVNPNHVRLEMSTSELAKAGLVLADGVLEYARKVIAGETLFRQMIDMMAAQSKQDDTVSLDVESEADEA